MDRLVDRLDLLVMYLTEVVSHVYWIVVTINKVQQMTIIQVIIDWTCHLNAACGPKFAAFHCKSQSGNRICVFYIFLIAQWNQQTSTSLKLNSSRVMSLHSMEDSEVTWRMQVRFGVPRSPFVL
mmetsp:Transcript_21251/g.37386  ORF Transcript_21251/g.37386 Transcript_21251/m.37386 type:complete len:124 (-) Transcript_21251:46-417(-)